MKRMLRFYWFILLFVTASIHATPQVIAHRGGRQNFPENTLLAFSKALECGCDAIELDVQVTQDGVVAVYHPGDLGKWTNGVGSVASHDWKYVSKLDAGFNYKPEENFPFRNQNLRIPTIEQVINEFPSTLIIIDLKSLPAEALVKALIQSISDEESERLVFYSTDSEHIDWLNHYKPHWRTFEKRDFTRQRLLDINQNGFTALPVTSQWMGFELKRKMVVTETFALGQGVSNVEFHLWTPDVVSTLRSCDPSACLVLFGINDRDDWKEAVDLDVSAVYTDNPTEIFRMTASITH